MEGYQAEALFRQLHAVFLRLNATTGPLAACFSAPISSEQANFWGRDGFLASPWHVLVTKHRRALGVGYNDCSESDLAVVLGALGLFFDCSWGPRVLLQCYIVSGLAGMSFSAEQKQDRNSLDQQNPDSKSTPGGALQTLLEP